MAVAITLFIIVEVRESMGMYLNPGKIRFQMAVDSAIFVDKTEMIS